jgi:hypothetical protein
MSHLDTKALVVAGRQADADIFAGVARRINYRSYDIETSVTSILSRFQDTSYKMCFLFESIVGKEGMPRLLERLRGNIQGKQVPIVIICSGSTDRTYGQEYYDEGVQLVINDLATDTLEVALLITSSWITFCDQFKEGREKFFRRS